jgi:NAD(P)-dependent dehydrogenase (short-subunit alcohol dehydrogenase family)
MPNVLITGTSTGIGRAAAVELAKRDWRVFATMRNTTKSASLIAALEEAGVRGQVEIGALDVTQPSSIEAAVERTLAHCRGGLDAVVHNAGVAVGGAFEDLPDAELRRVMETNFFGVLALTRALLPTLRAQRRGRIVAVTSEAAFFGQPGNSIYSASKWAVEGWAEALAYEVSQFGIEVILVEPGPYKTNIWESSERIRPADSAYRLWSQKLFLAADQHVEATARDPAEVGRAIANVLEARRPRFRNPVGPLSRLNHALRGKVPSRLLRIAISRYLGLPR